MLRKKWISLAASFCSQSTRHCDQCTRMSLSCAASSPSSRADLAAACSTWSMRAEMDDESAAIVRLLSASASSVDCTHDITARLNSTCSRTCQSSARATSRFIAWMMPFNGPPRRGFTVPMLATLPSAASRACMRAVRSGTGTPSADAPFGFRARTRRRSSSTTAASSSLLRSTFPAPTRCDFSKDAAARGKFACYRRRHRPAGANYILQEPVHDVLLKDSQIAISQHVHLQRFQLEAQLVGRVAQRDLAVIGQAGFRTHGGEFRQHDFDFVAGILIRPGLDLRQRRFHAGPCVFIGILSFHSAGTSIRASSPRNKPTSVTTPMAWPVPRSLTLVATAGLMSTQTIFTQLGSMLPTAME